MPRRGAHSMIERPEPVSRVAPPRPIMTKIIAATMNSQPATTRRFGRLAARSLKDAPGKSPTSKGMPAYTACWELRILLVFLGFSFFRQRPSRMAHPGFWLLRPEPRGQ